MPDKMVYAREYTFFDKMVYAREYFFFFQRVSSNCLLHIDYVLRLDGKIEVEKIAHVHIIGRNCKG